MTSVKAHATPPSAHAAYHDRIGKPTNSLLAFLAPPTHTYQHTLAASRENSAHRSHADSKTKQDDEDGNVCITSSTSASNVGIFDYLPDLQAGHIDSPRSTVFKILTLLYAWIVVEVRRGWGGYRVVESRVTGTSYRSQVADAL